MWSDVENRGVTIPYVNISLHAAQAASTTPAGATPARIYMQLDHASHLLPESTTNGNNHVSGEDEEEDLAGGLVEIHIVPNDPSTCISSFWHVVDRSACILRCIVCLCIITSRSTARRRRYFSYRELDHSRFRSIRGCGRWRGRSQRHQMA